MLFHNVNTFFNWPFSFLNVTSKNPSWQEDKLCISPPWLVGPWKYFFKDSSVVFPFAETMTDFKSFILFTASDFPSNCFLLHLLRISLFSVEKVKITTQYLHWKVRMSNDIDMKICKWFFLDTFIMI